MLIKELDKKLLETGYKKIASNVEEISVYYKADGDQPQIIHLIHQHEKYFLNAQQYGNLQRQVRQLFINKGYFNLNMITVIIAADVINAKEISANDFSSWIIDEKNNQLLIYEDRPIDFYGLKEALYQVLDDIRMEGKNNREENYPINRRINDKKTAICNISIIVINVLVFMIQELGGSTQDASYMVDKGAMIGAYVFVTKEYYRFITCMFMHFGIQHLLNNMVVLFFLGDNLERAVGRIKYIIIYLLSGIGGSLVSLAVAYSNDKFVVSAGASGAIFGVMGALLFVVISNKGRLETMTTKKIGLLIAISLYHGFTSTGVDNMAHLGGMIAGFFLAILLYRKDLSISR